MAKTLYDLAKEASLLLNDSQHCDGEYDFTRWSQAELANYGLNAIILAQTVYPQKFTKVVKVALVQGSIQSLPEGCSKLVKVLGSNDEAGTVPSTSSSIDDRLAGIFPDSGCGGSVTFNQGGYTVKNYSLEESSDTIFYVKPPVPFSEKPIEISVICSASPDTDPRKSHIPAWLWNPIIEFMMYRAYQSEDESQNSMQQMQIHLKNFYSMIEMYMRSEMMLTTNIGKQEVQNEAA